MKSKSRERRKALRSACAPVVETLERRVLMSSTLVSGPTVVNEGSAYTLHLANEPSTTNWNINWGDGATSTATGGTTTAQHTYADGPSTHTITASVSQLTSPLDTTFGAAGTGKATLDLGTSSDFAYDVALQSDGRIVTAGGPNFSVARFNSDGTPDTTFGAGGYVTQSSPDTAAAVAIQPDGKILVGGGNWFGLMRFNANGSLDTTFGGGTGKSINNFGVSYNASDMTLLSNGKIVLVGKNSTSMVIARFNADGSIDSSFGTNGKTVTSLYGTVDRAYAVTAQSDGKLIVVGQARNGSTDYNWAIARYTASGQLDTTFGTNGEVSTDFGAIDESAYDVGVQPDGKIVVAGYTKTASTGYYDFAVARYTSAGTLDSTFGSGGKVVTDIGHLGDQAQGLSILANGNILVVGQADNSTKAMNFGLAMYTSSGTLDSSFGTGGIVTTDFNGRADYGEAVTVQADGDFVVAGSAAVSTSSSITDFGVARYSNNSQSMVVSVNNVAPTVAISGSSNPFNPVIGNNLHFTSVVTDPGSLDTEQYAWTATTNGTVAATGNASSFDFEPSDPGAYTISLQVTDKDGGVGNATPITESVSDISPGTSTGTTAEFQDGNGTSSWDQYSGTSGNGWVSGWKSNNTSATISAGVQNTNPLNSDGNGNYLSTTITSADYATSGNARAAVSRQYETTGVVGAGDPYEVQLDYRLDSDLSGFSDLYDQVYIFGDDNARFNPETTDTILASAFGAAGSSMPAKIWGLVDSTGSTRFVNTGISLVQSDVYHFAFVIDPTNDTYVGTVTDKTTGQTFTSGTLGWDNQITEGKSYIEAGGRLTNDGSGGGDPTSLTYSIDAVSVTAPPSLSTTQASASPNPVTGTQATLSVLGSSPDGESHITYTWSDVSKPTGAADPSFSANGTNAAKNSVATFSQAGDYTLRVTLTDGSQILTSDVAVSVAQTLTTISVSPASVSIAQGAAQQFAATADDQFGNVMATQPPLTWSVSSGAGSISAAGNFTASSTDGSYSVVASSGGVSGSTGVNVIDGVAPVVAHIAGNANTSEGSPYTLSLSATGSGVASITSWTVNWGDGVTDTVTGNPSSAGHTYADGPTTYTITAAANVGASAYAAAPLSIAVANLPPAVAITGAPTAPTVGTSISLGSTVTDPSSTDQASPFTYAWTVTFGGNTVSSSASSTLTFTPTISGTYTVSFVATDKDGGSSSPAVISLDVANAPYEIQLSPTTVDADQLVSANLIALSSVSSTVSSWRVNWGDGTIDNVSTSAASTNSAGDMSWDASHTYLSPGTYSASAVAVDSDGDEHATESITETVKIPAPTIAPLAISSSTVDSPLKITAAAAPYQNNGDTLSYEWMFTSPSGQSTTTTTSGPVVTFTPTVVGQWSVSLTVTDTVAQASSSVQQSLNVVAAPGLSISGPSTVDVGDSADFNVIGSSGSSVGWTVSKNGSVVASGTGVSFSFSPSVTGGYDLIATGTDSSGNPSTASAALSVTKLAPSVTIKGDGAVFAGRPDVLTAVPTAGDGSSVKLNYQWKLLAADGSPYQYTADTEAPQSNLSTFAVPGSLEVGTYRAQIITTDANDPTSFSTSEFVLSVLAQPNSGQFRWGGVPLTGLLHSFADQQGDMVTEMLRQADGKIVAAIPFNDHYENTVSIRIARFNSDLTLDTSFGTAHTGLIELNPASYLPNFSSTNQYAMYTSYVHALAIDPSNGDIVVVGTTRGFIASSSLFVTKIVSTARTDANGHLLLPGDVDTQFHNGTPFELNINEQITDGTAVNVLQDGSVLVGGEAYFGGTSDSVAELQSIYGTSADASSLEVADFLLLKLNASGSLDGSFGQGGLADQADVNGIAHDTIRQIDLSETTGSGTGYYPFYGLGIQKIHVRSDGRIVVVGELDRSSQDRVATPDIGLGLAQYNASGSVDTSFGDGGRQFIGNDVLAGSLQGISTVDAVNIDSSGSIDVAGMTAKVSDLVPTATGTAHLYMAKFDADGSEDSSFGTNGIVQDTSLTNIGGLQRPGVVQNGESGETYLWIDASMAFRDDGDLIAQLVLSSATSQNQSIALVALSPDGSIDTSFGNSGRVELTAADLGEMDQPNTDYFATQHPEALVVDGSSILLGGVHVQTNYGTVDDAPTVPTVVRYEPSASLSTSNATATADGQSSVKLTWENSGYGEDGFVIERSATESGLGSDPSIIGRVGASQRDFVDTELSADTTYFYRVVAFTNGADGVEVHGSMSAETSVHTLPVDLSGFQFQEALDVAADGSIATTATVLQSGVTYVLAVSGTFGLTSDASGDAADWFSNEDGKAYGKQLNDESYGLSLGTSGSSTAAFTIPNWGDFSADTHSYEIAYVGGGSTLSFAMKNGAVGDSPLLVQIYAMNPTSAGQGTTTLPAGAPSLQIGLPTADEHGAMPVISAAAPINILAAFSNGDTVPWELRLVGPTGQSSVIAEGTSSSGTVSTGSVNVATLQSTAYPAGVYTLILQSNFGETQQDYSVSQQVAIIPPVLRILARAASDDGVTPVISSNQDIQITATATDRSSVPWKLLLIPKSGTGGAAVLASGTSSAGSLVGPGTSVVTLDPSRYANGNYTLELTTAYNGTQPDVLFSRQISLETAVKTGGLAFSATEETIASAVGQIGITRSFDSTQVSLNDTLPSFGNGWTFDTIDTRIEITGQNDTYDPTQPLPVLRAGDRITFNIPGDGKHVFEFDPQPWGANSLYNANPEAVLYKAHFVAVDGSGATLTLGNGGYEDPYYFLAYSPLDNEFMSVETVLGHNYVSTQPGSFRNVGFNPGDPYWSRGWDGVISYKYNLTLSSGLSYAIDAGSGQIDSVTDTGGNTETYNVASDGTVTATGPNGAILFTAHVDSSRRITEIDAAGQGVLHYGYDSNGNLTSAQDSQGRTTTYGYQDPSAPHAVTSITNASGITVLQARYDAITGELQSITNAEGKQTSVEASELGVNGAVQTVVDAMGNVTQDVYDEKFGMLVRKIQTLTNADGTVKEYVVTPTGFDYVQDNVADMSSRRTSGVDMLESESSFQSFEIDGTDASGERYSQAPSPDSWEKKITFNTSDIIGDPAAEQISESQVNIGANGSIQSTIYSRYQAFSSDNGARQYFKPELVVTEMEYPDAAAANGYDDRVQSTTYATYDSNANLIDSLTVTGRNVPGGGDTTELPGGFPTELYVNLAGQSRQWGLKTLAWDAASHSYFWSESTAGPEISLRLMDTTISSGGAPSAGDRWTISFVDAGAIYSQGLTGNEQSVLFDGSVLGLSTLLASFFSSQTIFKNSVSNDAVQNSGISSDVPGWVAEGEHRTYTGGGDAPTGELNSTANVTATLDPDELIHIVTTGAASATTYYGISDYQNNTPGQAYGAPKYQIDAAGQETFFAYDAAGRTVLQYVYKTWTDSSGNAVSGWVGTTNVYDSAGRLKDMYEATYRDASAQAGGAGPHTLPVITGGVAGLQVNTSVCPVYSAPLLTKHNDYDALGRIADTKDEYGRTTTNIYDSFGNTIEVDNADGTKTLTVYDSLNRAIWSTNQYDPSNASTCVTTRTVYDQLGNVVEAQQYAGVLIQRTTKQLGTKTVQTTAVATVDGTPNGLPSSSTLLSTTQTYYDPSGRAIEVISPTGQRSGTLRTGTIYTPDGKVLFTGELKSSAPDGGHLVTVGGVTSRAYLPSDFVAPTESDPTQFDSALGLFYTQAIDQNGRATKTYTDALGRTIRTVYDDGSFTETLYSSGTTPVTVDQEDDSIAVPAGISIQPGGYEEVSLAQRKAGDAPVATVDLYDASNRLTDVWLPAVTDGESQDDGTHGTPNTVGTLVTPHWHYTYDAAGNNLTQTSPTGHDANGSVTPSGNTTSFGYDQNGNQVRQTLPDGQVQTWTYNTHQQVATHSDLDGNVATYTYAPSGLQAGDLTSVTYGAAPSSGKSSQTVSYTYNDLNQQQTVTDASGTTTSTYDVLGDLIESDTPEGTIHYGFDLATGDHVETSTANTDTLYSYDEQGRLFTVTVTKLNGTTLSTPLVTTYGYDAAGNKTSETLPDSEVTTWGYDDLNRLKSVLEQQGSTSLFSQSYVISSNGQRQSSDQSQLQPDGSVVTTHSDWTYDADDRLKTETVTSTAAGESYANVFAYDLDNNRTQSVHTGPGVGADETITYTYDGNDELIGQHSTLSGDTSNHYDANGSLTSSSSGGITSTYSYDTRNKMVGYSNGTTTASYVYDDAGNRVSETVTTGGVSTTTQYLTDTQNPTGYSQPIEEKVNGSTTPSRTYILGDRVLGQADAIVNMSYLLIDGHGSTQQMTNANGTIIATYRYDAFGTAVNFSAATASTPFLFGGDAIYDTASGLYLHGNGIRATWGFFFIERDTFSGVLGDPLSLHKYLYAQSTPVNRGDPSGDVSIGTLGAVGTGLALEAGAAGVGGGATGEAEEVVDELETIGTAVEGEAEAIGNNVSNALQKLQWQQTQLVLNQQPALRSTIQNGDSLGEYWNQLGGETQDIADNAVELAAPEGSQIVNNYNFPGVSGSGSQVDNLISKSGINVFVETKYSLPTDGASLTRVYNQLTNGVNALGSGDSIILNVARTPTSSELSKFLSGLPPEVIHHVQVVTNVTDLYQAVKDAF